MRQRRVMNQINVVPYIDVMLVLLVIFMVTAPMMPSGTVDLPKMQKTSQAKEQPLIVTVKGRDNWTLEDRQTNKGPSSVKEQELLERLKAAQEQNPDRPVVIQADKKMSYEEVMKLMDLLQRNNVNKVGLLVQSAQ
ncbi:protein TolR [Uliginosibacterium sp. 31-16]|uniref:protein TolR n=1 Tax=Uliginosibacterium sp. 31-16 TaxID=3068315 RepID=UPI00273EFA6A|nr:protein TolR [Uliginosibacterium sp. 31-16]MDP5238696.1 protein TolR [Uliginosibacterium sp. 31-16]